MKMTVTSGGTAVMFELNDSPAARSPAAQLPLTPGRYSPLAPASRPFIRPQRWTPPAPPAFPPLRRERRPITRPGRTWRCSAADSAAAGTASSLSWAKPWRARTLSGASVEPSPSRRGEGAER